MRLPASSLLTLQQSARYKILDTYFKVNAGHIACSLSCIDLMLVIFFQHKEGNDKFILSKGHAVVALYICLHQLGEISDDMLETFYQDGTSLPAHPAPNKLYSIPFATGSLGHGFPIAAGIAKAKKLKRDLSRVFVLMSDGETNEGTTWEAAHFAVHHQLNNLIVIIDKNGIQGFGNTNEIFGDTACRKKWESIGFDVKEVNGHSIGEIDEALQQLLTSSLKSPKLIIANTIKGKGVTFMESKMEWHYLPMTKEMHQAAIQEVKAKYGDNAQGILESH